MIANRRPLERLLRDAMGVLILAAASLGAMAGPRVPSWLAPDAAVARAEPKVQPALPDAPVPVPRADLAQALRVMAPASAKALRLPDVESQPIGAPVQVGFARALDSLALPEAVAEQLVWQSRGDGTRVAALSVTSVGAAGVRAGLLVDSLPEAATLRFYAPGSTEVFAATAREVSETIARNAAAGDGSVEGRTFWSPVVEGETLALEIELPSGAQADDVRIAIPVLSHLVASPRDGFAKASSSCELDAMCQQDAWSVESNAVARIIFTSGGSSFLCTGTLLADRDTSTFIPYFLTANHCVSSQAAASSVQAYWFWRATACNSGVRGASQTTFGGGTLLYTTTATDTAFMRLTTQPPAGVAYAGWIASAPTQGTAVTGIHNPGGDLQKISSGNIASFWNCAAAKPEEFSCSGASAVAASFMGVTWRSGLTEAGSSGSGVFTDSGHYLVGQLFGGNGSCSAPGTDFYGRFDVAYNAALSQWLGTTSGTTGATPAADFTDLWWNANESGWGLSLTQHGGALFGAWFAYDAAGRSTWYVIPGGRWTTSTVFVGDVYATKGPDPTAANFDPTRVVRTKVGTATLRFSGTAQASFSYTVNGASETRTITRQPFGSGSAVTNGFGDLWWNASESGWGLSLSQQGNTLFGVWYTYAPDGSPAWFVLPGGTWTASDTYTGTLFRTASSGAYFGRGFDPSAVVRTDAGHVTLRFLDANTALMTYSLDGVFGIKQITRQPF